MARMEIGYATEHACFIPLESGNDQGVVVWPALQFENYGHMMSFLQTNEELLGNNRELIASLKKERTHHVITRKINNPHDSDPDADPVALLWFKRDEQKVIFCPTGQLNWDDYLVNVLPGSGVRAPSMEWMDAWNAVQEIVIANDVCTTTPSAPSSTPQDGTANKAEETEEEKEEESLKKPFAERKHGESTLSKPLNPVAAKATQEIAATADDTDESMTASEQEETPEQPKAKRSRPSGDSPAQNKTLSTTTPIASSKEAPADDTDESMTLLSEQEETPEHRSETKRTLFSKDTFLIHNMTLAKAASVAKTCESVEHAMTPSEREESPVDKPAQVKRPNMGEDSRKEVQQDKNESVNETWFTANSDEFVTTRSAQDEPPTAQTKERAIEESAEVKSKGSGQTKAPKSTRTAQKKTGPNKRKKPELTTGSRRKSKKNAARKEEMAPERSAPESSVQSIPTKMPASIPDFQKKILPLLKKVGLKCVRGKYFLPGVDPSDADLVLDKDYFANVTRLRRHLCAYGIETNEFELSEQTQESLMLWISTSIVSGFGGLNGEVKPKLRTFLSTNQLHSMLMKLGFGYRCGGAPYFLPGEKPNVIGGLCLNGRNMLGVEGLLMYLARFGLPQSCTLNNLSDDERLHLEYHISQFTRVDVLTKIRPVESDPPLFSATQAANSTDENAFQRSKEGNRFAVSPITVEIGKDDEWNMVDSKMKALGWTYKNGQGLDSFYYFAPGGKHPLKGGQLGIDYVKELFGLKKYAYDHLGWGGDEAFKKELKDMNSPRSSRRRSQEHSALTSTKSQKKSPRNKARDDQILAPVAWTKVAPADESMTLSEQEETPEHQPEAKRTLFSKDTSVRNMISATTEAIDSESVDSMTASEHEESPADKLAQTKRPKRGDASSKKVQQDKDESVDETFFTANSEESIATCSEQEESEPPKQPKRKRGPSKKATDAKSKGRGRTKAPMSTKTTQKKTGPNKRKKPEPTAGSRRKSATTSNAKTGPKKKKSRKEETVVETPNYSSRRSRAKPPPSDAVSLLESSVQSKPTTMPATIPDFQKEILPLLKKVGLKCVRGKYFLKGVKPYETDLVLDKDYFANVTRLRQHLCAYGIETKGFELSVEQEGILMLWISTAIVPGLHGLNGEVKPELRSFLSPGQVHSMLMSLGFKYRNADGYYFLPGEKPNLIGGLCLNGRRMVRDELRDDDGLLMYLARFGLPPSCAFNNLSDDERLHLEYHISQYTRVFILTKFHPKESDPPLFGEEDETNDPEIYAGESSSKSRPPPSVSHEQAEYDSRPEAMMATVKQEPEESGMGIVLPHIDAELGRSDEVAFIKEYVMTISKSDDVNMIKDTMGKLADGLVDEEQLDEKEQEFRRVGGPIILVTVMDKHADNDQIQGEAMRVLVNATYRDTNYQLTSLVSDVAGNEAIVKAMTKHPASIEIQRRGLKALCNMSCLKEIAEKLVLQLEIVPLIIETMTEFSGNAFVVVLSCRLLKKLSSYEKLRKPMVDANVLSALGRAIEGHRDNEEIQDTARGTMKHLL